MEEYIRRKMWKCVKNQLMQKTNQKCKEIQTVSGNLYNK